MKALIILGGDAPDPEWLRQVAKGADRIVCADRGALYAVEAGLCPHVLLGDMDSLPQETLEGIERTGVAVERYPVEKDDTDGMLAVRYAMGQGATDITIAGGLGGRLDHAMSNVQLLVYARLKGVEAVMSDGMQNVYATDGDLTLQGEPGDIFSIIPLGRARVHEAEGLFYPLKDTVLPPDVPLGVSNVMTGNTAHILVDQGMVMVYHLKGGHYR